MALRLEDGGRERGGDGPGWLDWGGGGGVKGNTCFN